MCVCVCVCAHVCVCAACCGLEPGLEGDHQRLNAALAIELCKAWMMETGRLPPPPEKSGGSPLSLIPLSIIWPLLFPSFLFTPTSPLPLHAPADAGTREVTEKESAAQIPPGFIKGAFTSTHVRFCVECSVRAKVLKTFTGVAEGRQ